jgi:transcriptional regulator with XRE-family HTH domain
VDGAAAVGRAARSGGVAGIGAPLRAARERRGLSLRELARRVGVTASHISLIETGKSRPSVDTLYRLAGELRLSIDELLAQAPCAAGPFGQPEPAEEPAAAEPADPSSPVLRRHQRKVIHLEEGVRWERLTHRPDPLVDFLYVVYDVGGASSSDHGAHLQHEGTEYVLVLEGTLALTLEGDTHTLEAGDSASFDATARHGYATVGDAPARFVAFIARTR